MISWNLTLFDKGSRDLSQLRSCSTHAWLFVKSIFKVQGLAMIKLSLINLSKPDWVLKGLVPKKEKHVFTTKILFALFLKVRFTKLELGSPRT